MGETKMHTVFAGKPEALERPRHKFENSIIVDLNLYCTVTGDLNTHIMGLPAGL
jgi:hypothetical protein